MEDIHTAKCHFTELYPRSDKETGAPIILPTQTQTETQTNSKKLAPNFEEKTVSNIKLMNNEQKLVLTQDVKVGHQ